MITAAEFRAREAASMSEDVLLGKVRGMAATLGWLTYHTHDSRRSEPGFPDLVLVKGERVLYRELKKQSGRVDPAQKAWMGALADAGVDVAIWRPADLLSGAIREALLAGGRHESTVERQRVIAAAQHKRRAAALRRGAAKRATG